jgi:hypothetical protein
MATDWSTSTGLTAGALEVQSEAITVMIYDGDSDNATRRWLFSAEGARALAARLVQAAEECERSSA